MSWISSGFFLSHGPHTGHTGTTSPTLGVPASGLDCNGMVINRHILRDPSDLCPCSSCCALKPLTRYLNTLMMSDGLFYPMAPAHSVPTIVQSYHFQHLPPPSNPLEFMSSLRRGLRGANEVGLWGKLKCVGWRFLRECRVSASQSVLRLTTFVQSNLIIRPLRFPSTRASRLLLQELPVLLIRCCLTST